jgi:hypothetical protein
MEIKMDKTWINTAGQRNKNYDVCDLMKFIFSILIFILHTNLFFGLSPKLILASQLLARGGVPFFFIASAFFLFSRQEESGSISRETLIKYVRRVAGLYFVWLVINLPSVVYTKLAYRMTTAGFIRICLLSSSYSGSWFMMSCLFSAPVIYLLSKRWSTKTILLLCTPFFLSYVLSSAYEPLLPESISAVLRWLVFPTNIFVGLFYFALGKLLAERHKAVARISLRLSACLCALLFILFFCEILLLTRAGICGGNDAGFFLAPAALLCFISAMKSGKRIAHAKTLRKMSTIIYCCQGNALLVPNALVRVLHLPGIHPLSAFALRGAAVAAITLLVLYIQKKKPDCFFSRYAA